MTNNYLKIYKTTTDRNPQVHLFNDKNRLARTRALGLAQTAKRAAVYRRPDDMWANVPEIGDYVAYHTVRSEPETGPLEVV